MRERERKIIVALVRDRPLAYAFDIRLLDQRTLTVGGSITVRLVSNFTSLDSAASLHTTQFLPWSSLVLLNWRSSVQWNFPQWMSVLVLDSYQFIQRDLLNLFCSISTFYYIEVAEIIGKIAGDKNWTTLLNHGWNESTILPTLPKPLPM